MQLPHLNPIQWDRDIPESRFGSLIESSPAGCQIALIGIPDDTGVRLNNGRPGAKEGPAAFRKALSRYGVANPVGWDWPMVFDAGDINIVKGDLHETHQRITQAVESIVDLGLFPIAIGGGHDLTFPFVRGVTNKHGPMVGVYLDAHLDVRETDGSGMPFRRLIETGCAKSLRVNGLDPNANSREHVTWFTGNGGHISQLTHNDPWPSDNTFVSLDLDVIDQAFAPGVSAHNACGWSPTQTQAWIHEAGRNPMVRCFDIMELSPPHDQDGRTARLAARMFLTFLRGFSERHP